MGTKQLERLNKILETISSEPGCEWTGTQRDLSKRLGVHETQVTQLIKLLESEGKIVKGNPIPKKRGRTHTLRVVDSSPFTAVAGGKRKVGVSTTTPPVPLTQHDDEERVKRLLQQLLQELK